MELEGNVKMLEISEKDLSISRAHAILQMRQDSTPALPLRPDGGMVFLFYRPGKEEHWKADGYRWKNSGSKQIPSKAPMLEKTYFQLYVEGEYVPVATRTFRKVSYHLLGDREGCQGTLIHYLGVLPKKGVVTIPVVVKETRPSIMEVSDDVIVLERAERELPLTRIQGILLMGNHQTPYIPIRPEGGMVFLYCHPGKEDDWKADGYRWKNSGSKALPSKNPILEKTYYQLVVARDNASVANKDFSKVTYRLLGDADGLRGTLIHYLGTVPSGGVQYPHGNNKKHRETYIRTAPSVLKEAKNFDKYPSLCFSEMASNLDVPLSHEEVLKPRNVSQIKNAQTRARKVKRLSQCELYRVMDMAHSLKDFVHRYLLVPEVVLVLAHPSVLHALQTAICTTSPHPQLLTYDSTHNIGEFHITSLLFKHPLFEESPVYPAAFLVHEHSSELSVEMLFDVVAKKVPEVATALLLTDGSDNVVKAMANKLPLVRHLRNWNQVQMEVKHWLRRRGASELECRNCAQDLRDLLMAGSQEEYTKLYALHSGKWNKPFAEYFKWKIHPEVVSLIGRWVLQPLGVFNGFTGVNSHHCSDFGCLLKSFCERGEDAIDSIALGLYNLQCHFANEIQLSQAGVGRYTLLPAYKTFAIEADQTELHGTYALEEIVDRVLQQKSQEGYRKEFTLSHLIRSKRFNKNTRKRALPKEEVPPRPCPQIGSPIEHNVTLTNPLKFANKIKLIVMRNPSSTNSSTSLTKPS